MIDTKEARERAEMMGFTTNPLPRMILDLCNEIDDIRIQRQFLMESNGAYKADAQRIFEEGQREIKTLKAEVAALRERLGEKVCSKCGKVRNKTYRVNVNKVEADYTWMFDSICSDCLDAALSLLRKP